MATPTLLFSKRLYLRPLQLSDVTELYYRWMQDIEVTRFLENRFHHYAIQDLKNYVINILQDKSIHFFSIILHDSDRHIGNIKLGPINTAHQFADIGIMIGEKDCWRCGFAQEAIGSLVDYAFSHLRLHKLTAGCYQTNIGSIKAFLKSGFIIEGNLQKQYFSDGHYVDAVRLGLLNEAFKE